MLGNVNELFNERFSGVHFLHTPRIGTYIASEHPGYYFAFSYTLEGRKVAWRQETVRVREARALRGPTIPDGTYRDDDMVSFRVRLVKNGDGDWMEGGNFALSDTHAGIYLVKTLSATDVYKIRLVAF
jgi:hypothetical protein